jgi:hypothetical protein
MPCSILPSLFKLSSTHNWKKSKLREVNVRSDDKIKVPTVFLQSLQIKYIHDDSTIESDLSSHLLSQLLPSFRRDDPSRVPLQILHYPS